MNSMNSPTGLKWENSNIHFTFLENKKKNKRPALHNLIVSNLLSYTKGNRNSFNKRSCRLGWDTLFCDAKGVRTSDPLDPSLIRLLPATREGWGPKSLSAFKSPL